MSSAVVPYNPQSQQFTQQGQVDWVALSKSSVQFTVAFLARLSKAGVDALTIQVGRHMCRMFAFNPVGQERISLAITQLKKYGSYGNIIGSGLA